MSARPWLEQITPTTGPRNKALFPKTCADPDFIKAYVPTQVPMNISSWPTLSDMILMGKRAVIFIDYNANQTEIPYILDEFSQMWETPFSPTNQSFPCTQQRPPNLSRQTAENRMYMANHNLNTEISLAGTSLLVPTTALINQTNALSMCFRTSIFSLRLGSEPIDLGITNPVS